MSITDIAEQARTHILLQTTETENRLCNLPDKMSGKSLVHNKVYIKHAYSFSVI